MTDPLPDKQYGPIAHCVERLSQNILTCAAGIDFACVCMYSSYISDKCNSAVALL